MMRTQLRPELEAIIPERMRSRPIDERGYSVPWFVQYIDGKPDFRIMDRAKWMKAVKARRCWLCGEALGIHLTFCIGPMCVVNRVTSEPPSHRECAEYAARGCPFMTRPKAQYRTANLPDQVVEPAGLALMHNPTATALWTTRSYTVKHVGNGYLIYLGEPEEVSFWHQGRLATRAEVIEAIGVGLPKLREAAFQDGPDALALMERMHAEALKFLPAEVAA